METITPDSNIRAALQEQMRGLTETRCVRQQAEDVTPFEMREIPNGTGGTSLSFTGYASMVERGYEMWSPALGDYTEVIARDAFTKTLRENPDVSFKVNHDGLPMAKTSAGDLQLSSDSTGLYTEARVNPERADVLLMRQAIEAGHLNEMSFAFRVTRQDWTDDGMTRRIQEVNLNKGDVSVVEFGANPFTAGSLSLRNRLADAGVTAEQLVAAYRALTTFNETRALDPDVAACLSTVLQLVSIADTAVDVSQVLLSEMLGVENPDEDQDAALDEGTQPSDDGEAAAPRRNRLALVQLRSVAAKR